MDLDISKRLMSMENDIYLEISALKYLVDGVCIFSVVFMIALKYIL